MMHCLHFSINAAGKTFFYLVRYELQWYTYLEWMSSEKDQYRPVCILGFQERLHSGWEGIYSFSSYCVHHI